jgi:hypothetical protein
MSLHILAISNKHRKKKYFCDLKYIQFKAMRKNCFFDNSLSSRVQTLSKPNELNLPKIDKRFELAKISET